MKVKYIIQFVYYFYKSIKTPEDLKSIIKVGEALNKLGAFDVSVTHIKSLPGGEQFFSKRDLSFSMPKKEYEKFPIGSFGHCYFLHLESHNIDPGIFPEIKMKSDADFLENYIRKVHDVLHVVTGFDISEFGELALQGFKVRQIKWSFGLVVIAGFSLLTLIKRPGSMHLFIEHLISGYQKGGEIRNLCFVDWNALWNLPYDTAIEQLQQTDLPAVDINLPLSSVPFQKPDGQGIVSADL